MSKLEIQLIVKQGIFTIAVFLSVLACSAVAAAQASRPFVPLGSAAGSAQGQLTVTATVVASAGVVIGPDGQPRLIIANAPDPRDNASSLTSVFQLKDQPKNIPRRHGSMENSKTF